MNKNKFENERYLGAIALIKSQTNYTDEQAKNKLIKWEGNYMNVIKEYLNPNFNKKKVSSKKRSTNELMMSEIRSFMDRANSEFLKRKKKEEEKQEYLKQVYNKFIEVKKQYPSCMYDPPKIVSCVISCKNPMCPGELDENKKYNKI
tara:strand:+ start:1400 stop:1840 length:441 start_codon:yes stop_codon:yes gene_type:complete